MKNKSKNLTYSTTFELDPYTSQKFAGATFVMNLTGSTPAVLNFEFMQKQKTRNLRITGFEILVPETGFEPVTKGL